MCNPPGSRCTTPWELGTVTAILSPAAIEIGGTPRHISNIRKLEDGNGVGSNDVHGVDDNVQVSVDAVARCVPSRSRHPPTWMRDYA